MQVGDKVHIRYRFSHLETGKFTPATVTRMTKRYLIVVADGTSGERKFLRENGCEAIVGGGYCVRTRLLHLDRKTVVGPV